MTILLAAVDVWVYAIDRKAGFIMTVFILIYLGIAGRSVFLQPVPDPCGSDPVFQHQYKGIEHTLLKELAVPYAITLEDGRILWKNDAFAALMDNRGKKSI